MAALRSTFHDAWHRVARRRPRLRSTVQFHRRSFRGRTWYVVQTPDRDQLFRLGFAAWRFVGQFDGQRTVDEVWHNCAEELGDAAPTQGEALQLLLNLQRAQLLVPDADNCESDVSHQAAAPPRLPWHPLQLLSFQIPIGSPDEFLTRWAPVYAWVFGRVGLCLWVALLLLAGMALGNADASLAADATNALAISNLSWLYLALVLTKALHELAHAGACKCYGLRDGTSGTVGAIGIALVLLAPIPYVDASSSWLLRRQRDRIVVAAAGVMAELFVAALAALVWTQTSDGAALHALCYSVMLVAGISALVFNGNPLMRFDGYYILSDLLNLPNLSQRSFLYVQYLVQRYAWGVTAARSPAHHPRERGWLLGYACAATVFRVFLCGAILLVLFDWFFVVGVILAVMAAIRWGLLPASRLLHFLLFSPRLAPRRTRALASTLGVLLLLLVPLLTIPVTQAAVVPGVVEASAYTEVYAAADGFVEEIAAPGTRHPINGLLVTTRNPVLRDEQAQLEAERTVAELEQRIALRDRDAVTSQIEGTRLQLITRQLDRIRADRAALLVRAPLAGTWTPVDRHLAPGRFVRRGEHLGTVVSPSNLQVRAVASQSLAAQFFTEQPGSVRVRPAGRPELETPGEIAAVLSGGRTRLPSAALGQGAGGAIAVDPGDAEGTLSLEQFFEVRVRPQDQVNLRHGQRVRVCFGFPARPLAAQWFQSAARLLQRRFQVDADRPEL